MNSSVYVRMSVCCDSKCLYLINCTVINDFKVVCFTKPCLPAISIETHIILQSCLWSLKVVSRWNDNNDNLLCGPYKLIKSSQKICVFFCMSQKDNTSISSFSGQTIYIILGPKKFEANAVRLKQKIGEKRGFKYQHTWSRSSTILHIQWYQIKNFKRNLTRRYKSILCVKQSAPNSAL